MSNSSKIKSEKTTVKRKPAVTRNNVMSEADEFSQSSTPMTFTSAHALRFVRALDKHKVLSRFIKESKLDKENSFSFSPSAINLGKKLLAEKNAHRTDVFAKSIVGD